MLTRLFAALVLFAAMTTSLKSRAQNAEALLTRDLVTGMKTMSKPVRIYHYFNTPVQANGSFYNEFLTREGRASYISTNYLPYVTGKFWDLNFRANEYINAGPGVYLAIDPHVSTDFGNTMIEMEIAAGTRFLNVVKPIPIAKDTLAALIAEGVITSSQATFVFYKAAGPTKLGFYRDSLKNMTQVGYEKFRTLVSRIFQTVGLEFIEFNWKTDLPGFCTKTGSYSAFNYIGSQPYNGRYNGIPMTSSLNFPGLAADEQDLGARVGKFRDVLEQIAQLRKRGLPVPKDFALRYYTPAEYKQLKNMTFGCE